jgi:hypothetical protein
MQNYLAETQFLNFSHSSVQNLIAPISPLKSKKKQAIVLFETVRNAFLYDPFHLDLRPQALVCSSIIEKKRAWCVEKAIVLAAGLRGLNIPAALGYSIVQNHIGVEKLSAILQSEKIVFHGYVAVYLDNRWIKITPAFDPKICRIAGVEVLQWDGKNDALLQAFDGEKKFMEYHHDYGIFDDVPVRLMNSEMKKHYPHLFAEPFVNTKYFSFYHL